MTTPFPHKYFPETIKLAEFNPEHPQPKFIVELPDFKALVVGLEAGQQIPPHSGDSAIYHFLEGSGLVTINDDSYTIRPGATAVVPNGAVRGINARTRIIFLAAKGS